jgi:hypothetical protein
MDSFTTCTTSLALVVARSTRLAHRRKTSGRAQHQGGRNTRMALWLKVVVHSSCRVALIVPRTSVWCTASACTSHKCRSEVRAWSLLGPIRCRQSGINLGDTGPHRSIQKAVIFFDSKCIKKVLICKRNVSFSINGIIFLFRESGALVPEDTRQFFLYCTDTGIGR